jgi:phosphatidylglycerol---prolipoprotein diacylglyceryl transferase
MIEAYGFLILIGIILTLLFWIILSKYFIKSNSKLSFYLETAFNIYIISLMSGKLLYLIVDYNLCSESIIESITSGFSVLGASFGGIIGYLYIYIKHKNEIRILRAMYALPVVLPVLHAFGRIGCLCSGCCGGIVYIFKTEMHLQILSSLWYWLCFFTSLLIFAKIKNNYNTIFYMPIIFYSLAVALERFIFDFFRDDAIYNTSLHLTTYQIISISYFFFIIIIINTFIRGRN